LIKIFFRLSQVLVVVFLAAGPSPLKAEVRVGFPPTSRMRKSGQYIEYSRKGQFFATNNPEDMKDPSDASRKFPSYRRPWTSDGGQALFGVAFNYPVKPNVPGQLDRFEKQVPLFDNAEIWWGGHIPAPGTWHVRILTADGKTIRVGSENDIVLYPSDRSILRFKPTTIKQFRVEIEQQQGGELNHAAVRNILLHIQFNPNPKVTEDLLVTNPGFSMARFSDTSPGMLTDLLPANDLLYSGVQMFRWLAPRIEYKGVLIAPLENDVAVTIYSSNSPDKADEVMCDLTFVLPDDAGEVKVNVAWFFRKSANRSVELRMRAADAPPGVKLALQWYGSEWFFGSLIETSPILSGKTLAMRTPGGRMKFELEGSDEISLSKAKGLEPARNRMGKKFGWVEFKTLSQTDTLAVAISLPIGAAAQPQPEMLNYTWRPSVADEGGELGPFNPDDLELIEEINLGDPNDSHKVYDCLNDPLLPVLREEFGDRLKPIGHKYKYGWLTFLDQEPEPFAAPIKTVEGERCRVISDELGSYFRFDLDTTLEPRVSYLLAVEHAFDKSRRGEFHSILIGKKNNKIVNSVNFLFGGFESEADPNGGFRTEYFLSNKSRFRFMTTRNRKFSLVFSNIVKSAPWIKTPGLAVKSVRLYRVRRMPRLPDMSDLLPDDNRRGLMIWTEFCYEGPEPYYLFEYPSLIGYDAIMSHRNQSTRFLGQANLWQKPRDMFHPGSLASNTLLYEAAAKQGMHVNTYLGYLLNWGFEPQGRDSFAYVRDYHRVRIPVKPTPEELKHIAGALRHVMPKLAKYDSLRDVVAFFFPPFSKRDLEGFCAATGVELNPTLSYQDNQQLLIDGGPELVEQWQDWVCTERFRFIQWLLRELQSYRPDICITLNRYWERNEHAQFLAGMDIPRKNGVYASRLAPAGVNTFIDFERFMGIDPAMFADEPDVSMAMEACARLNSSMRPPVPGGDQIPDYYHTNWFKQLKSDFAAGGLDIGFHQRYEFSAPYCKYMCAFVFPKTEFRRQLVKAFAEANARNITIGQYNQPWGARLADLREFAVAYRLLPYTAPIPYKGAVSDTASQVIVRRHGDRYALVNRGDAPTLVDLELPPGKSELTDLSSGIRQKLPVSKNARGASSAKIRMKPWSLKTLEMN